MRQVVYQFSGVAAGEACTVVLRGSPNQIVDEGERLLRDALPAVPRGQGDPSRSRWWMLRDADEPCCGKDSEKG